uniref:D-sedoheptulose 7-phosphate isomerase n=1 Tax=Candidatus Aschnera chinzeii TaxID=1485666 RepID=A0AAT9G3S8_9ENTR|nr:MAG: D-sedoheptulose 7-phosphate isomerase [Candidatus Aschnera chinzeii]
MFYELINKELQTVSNILKQFIDNKKNIADLEQAAQIIANAFKINKKIISCGNGGSHCAAMHFAEELTGRYRNYRVSYPALAISDIAYFSCVANDYGYEYVFSRYIEAFGDKNDVLFILSTSGNSINLIHAIQTAFTKQMNIIALTGNDGGHIAGNVNLEIRVPYIGTSDRIQEIHTVIIHIIIFLVEKIMNSIS